MRKNLKILEDACVTVLGVICMGVALSIYWPDSTKIYQALTLMALAILLLRSHREKP